jgi:hypothetical protein
VLTEPNQRKKDASCIEPMFLLAGAIYDQAVAAPDCWDVIALNNQNQKVA